MKLGFYLLCVLLGVIGLIGFTACKETDDNALVGITWALESINYSSQNIVTVDKPFTILFKDDGTIDMLVDCNNCFGTYVLGANKSIESMDHGGCTEADCGPESKDDEFHAALDTVTRYDVDGNRMQLFFNNGDSTLEFTN